MIEIEQKKIVEEKAEVEEVIKKPKDKAFSFLLAQIFFCVIAVVFVIVLSAVGGEIYSYSRAVFDEKFNKPININQVLSAKQTNAVLKAQKLKPKKAKKVKKKEKDTTQAVSYTNVTNSMCLPVNGFVTSEFCYRVHPISGEYRFHSGIDLGAKMGADIRSSLDGTVAYIDDKGETSYGKYIMVRHAQGVTTLYGHCSRIVANLGQSVKKGEVIAKVGSTGNSTGPHLHFEVKVNGVKLNPRLFADFV